MPQRPGKNPGDLSKAISHLETAIQMDPSLELAYRKLAKFIHERTSGKKRGNA
jgi:Tfp pilus assembly protein PilF